MEDKGISGISRYIEEMLRQALYPAFIQTADEVKLVLPHLKQEEYRVGIWLYDIQDYSMLVNRSYQYIDDEHRKKPAMTAELSYMMLVQEESRFGGANPEEEYGLLQQIITVFHDQPYAELDGCRIQFCFAKLDLDTKLKLWQSLSKPLQPAVYIQAAPVLIEASRIEKFVRTKEEQVNAKHL